MQTVGSKAQMIKTQIRNGLYGRRPPINPPSTVLAVRKPAVKVITGSTLPVKPVVAPVATPVLPVTRIPNIKSLTICVLLYGDFLELAQRCIRSIYKTVDPSIFEMRIGMNAVSEEVANWVNTEIVPKGNVTLYTSTKNIRKYPKMREMFWNEPQLATEYVMWFDDDSWPEDPQWLSKLDTWVGANPNFKVAGKKYFQHLKPSQVNWLKTEPWYTGKDVDRRKGMPVSHFVTGGWWLTRTSVMKQLDWPSKTLGHNGGDVALGSAMFQNDIPIHEYYDGIRISDAARRGVSEQPPMVK